MTVFLDHASTTPCDARVAAAIATCLASDGGIGNASSVTHPFGRAAAAAVAAARAQVAALVNAPPECIVFTSGATESDNLAILGIARGRMQFGRHIVTARTEHKAVLDPCRQLEKQGWTITRLEPAADGRVSPEALRAALRADTQLVSLMHANNETGVVQDIAAFAAVCREQGVLFHSDAAQTAGKLPIDLGRLGVDLLSISAHKFYGPKGVGALYVAPTARPWVEPLAFGGGQERGLRPGTLPTQQIVGLGLAAEIAAREQAADAQQAAVLVGVFKNALRGLPGLRFNDAERARLPALVSVSCEGVEGESLLAAMPEIAVSSGAACDSASGEPSYVLRAHGVSSELARSTLRVCFGRGNSEADAALAAAVLRRAVLELRANDAPGEPADGPWVCGEAGSVREGTHIRCFIKRDTAGRIAALKFRAYACPDTWKVLRALERELPGHPPTAPPAGPRDWLQQHGLPVEKLGRLLMVEDAFHRACAAVESR